MSDADLTRLEEQIAHLARMVEDLNEVVTERSAEIDRLTRRVHALTERLAEQQDSGGGGSVLLGDQKPPHW